MHSVEEMKDLFSRGYSTRHIGEKLGISKETVRRHLMSAGIDTNWPNNKKASANNYAVLIRQMLDAGKGWIEISDEIGFSARQLQRYVYGK
jgi:hypothetical protein